ncbi:MAG: LapA family protein [Rhodoferax sp.]|nr:LapA family protein [Rhodoferax sp.]
MKRVLWLLRWLLKAAVFFTLLAFALNNQQEADIHFFFGTRWHAPMVLIVLAAFALGLAVGALGMVPRWWRQRRAAALARRLPTAEPAPPEPVIHAEPTRHGL